MNGEKSLTEALSKDGVDWSLMTGLDIQHLRLYGKTRMELSKKYPKPEALMEDEEDTINIPEARKDSLAPLFTRCVMLGKEIYDRVGILQNMATEYEKKVVRIYSHLTNNWSNPKVDREYRKAYRDSDLYEIVESYFKILRKYGLTTQEEPYYFLSPQHKRAVKVEGEMLKRSTQIDDSEINISIMEILP